MTEHFEAFFNENLVKGRAARLLLLIKGAFAVAVVMVVFGILLLLLLSAFTTPCGSPFARLATKRIGSLPNELVLVTRLRMDSKCFYNLLPVATTPAPLLHLFPLSRLPVVGV